MAERRRIVIDASVMSAGHFRETLTVGGAPFDITRRARPVVEAVRAEFVKTYAPELLHVEFMKVADRKVRPRDGSRPLDRAEVELVLAYFLDLRIVYVPGIELASKAWELVRSHGISVADSWYVACALLHEAELWLTHAQSDDIVNRARDAECDVHALSTEKFDR